MKWVLLGAAILLEVFATTSLKLSDGFTRVWWSMATVLGYVGSFAFLTFAIKKLDIGTAYAIWSGVGTAVIAVIGLTIFGEKFGWLKLSGIALVVIGVVAINFGDHAHG